jgi:anaerobic carbon-monoxide dehydrogenase iron sulfur subunit
MPKALSINQEKCTGCRACEIACSFKHHGEFNPTKSNIHVSIYAEEASFVPLTCTQCTVPLCKEVCPTGALQKSEAGGAPVINVIEEKCVGCKMCMLACPFGCITVSESGYAQKCDLCEGNPECVIFCSVGALEFKQTEESALQKKRALVDKFHSHKEESK